LRRWPRRRSNSARSATHAPTLWGKHLGRHHHGTRTP